MVVLIIWDLVRFYFFGLSEIPIVRFPLGHSYLLSPVQLVPGASAHFSARQNFAWLGIAGLLQRYSEAPAFKLDSLNFETLF